MTTSLWSCQINVSQSYKHPGTPKHTTKFKAIYSLPSIVQEGDISQFKKVNYLEYLGVTLCKYICLNWAFPRYTVQ